MYLNDMPFFETIFLTNLQGLPTLVSITQKLRGQKNNKEKFSYSVKMNSNGLMEIDPFVLDTQSGKEYSC